MCGLGVPVALHFFVNITELTVLDFYQFELDTRKTSQFCEIKSGKFIFDPGIVVHSMFQNVKLTANNCALGL